MPLECGSRWTESRWWRLYQILTRESAKRLGVVGHQGVAEIPQRSQGLVFGRAVAGKLVKETARHKGMGAAGVGGMEMRTAMSPAPRFLWTVI